LKRYARKRGSPFIYSSTSKCRIARRAEDITLETYVKATSYLQSGRVAPNKYIAFLRTVAHNLLRDGWRRKKRGATEVAIDAIHPQD